MSNAFLFIINYLITFLLLNTLFDATCWEKTGAILKGAASEHCLSRHQQRRTGDKSCFCSPLVHPKIFFIFPFRSGSAPNNLTVTTYVRKLKKTAGERFVPFPCHCDSNYVSRTSQKSVGMVLGADILLVCQFQCRYRHTRNDAFVSAYNNTLLG